MRFTPTVLLSLVLILTQCVTSCSSANQNASNSPASNTNNSTPIAKDNIHEFADLVQLPFEPEEVAWNEQPGKGLTAVVRFSAEDAERMTADLARSGQPAAETVTVESWFPAELLAQSDLTGESAVKGQSFSAASFLKPPYTSGKIIRVEGTDYFILQISS